MECKILSAHSVTARIKKTQNGKHMNQTNVNCISIRRLSHIPGLPGIYVHIYSQIASGSHFSQRASGIRYGGRLHIHKCGHIARAPNLPYRLAQTICKCIPRRLFTFDIYMVYDALYSDDVQLLTACRKAATRYSTSRCTFDTLPCQTLSSLNTEYTTIYQPLCADGESPNVPTEDCSVFGLCCSVLFDVVEDVNTFFCTMDSHRSHVFSSNRIRMESHAARCCADNKSELEIMSLYHLSNVCFQIADGRVEFHELWDDQMRIRI